MCAAVDVDYLSTGEARAAAVLAADAAFAHVLAERTAMVPRVPVYRPGEFYRRELPPLRAVLGDLCGLGPLVVDGDADLDPSGPRPGRAGARRVRHPGNRGGQVQVPHGDPRGAGLARILGAPVPSGDYRNAASLAGLTDSPSGWCGGDRAHVEWPPVATLSSSRRVLAGQ